MNICVINGSPKGRYSITLQTALYLEKCFPAHHFTILHVGQRIRQYENDMSEAVGALAQAELVLFSYPVYTFLAPSQLHRFIELLKRERVELAGKYATQITTSKHFYDITAHRYVEDNCHDMGLRVIHGLSADMDDLLSEAGQADARRFMKYVAHCVANGICEPDAPREPPIAMPCVPIPPPVAKTGKFDTVIVADLSPEDAALRGLIDAFTSSYPYPARLVNIAQYPFQGGCLGCFHCAGDGKCVYKDGFDTFLREEIQRADAVVYAFTISDHSMGARLKRYDDRQFCNGHRTVTEGKPFGYLINGNYAREPNLQTVIEARCEVGHNFLAGAGCDAETLRALVSRLAYALENRYVQPRNFWGVGGMKIFRDLIWMMRGLMKADHDFYKAHGIYDFPQKHRLKMWKMRVLGAMVRNPKIRSKMGNRFNEGMLAPYAKALNGARPE